MLHPSHEIWKNDGIESRWLYRGQNDGAKELLPSAWRILDDPRVLAYKQYVASKPEVIEQIGSHPDPDKPPFGLEPTQRAKWEELAEATKRERIREFLIQIALETEFIRDFWTIGTMSDTPFIHQIGSRKNSLFAT